MMFPLAPVSVSAVASKDFLLCEIKRSVGFPVKSDAVAEWKNLGTFFFGSPKRKHTYMRKFFSFHLTSIFTTYLII